MSTDHKEAMRLAEPPNIDNLKKIAASDSTTAIRNALLASIKWIQCLEQSLKFEQAASFRNQVAELSAEREQLRAEVERLRADAEQWQAHKEVLKASHLDESLTIRMTMRHKGLNVEREGVLTMLAAEHAIAGGDEIAAHMAGRYFNEMKSAIDLARTTHKDTE